MKRNVASLHRQLRRPDRGGWHPRARCPQPLRAWLMEPNSLSARIAAACPAAEPFRLELLFSGSGRPTRDEGALIGAARHQRVRVREVKLCAGRTPLVFAHSVTGLQQLRGPWRLMSRLGGGVLGSILFADPRIRRGAIAFRALDRRDALYRRAASLGGPLPARLWARRALFHRKGKPLLVTEVFLPAMESLQR